MTDRCLATSAHYADAMLVARRAKNWLFLFILLMLLLQMTFFFVARYTHAMDVFPPPPLRAARRPPATVEVSPATTEPTTIPSIAATSGPTVARVHRSGAAE